MNQVLFEIVTPKTGNKEKDVPTLYIRLPKSGSDFVCRKATEADKEAHKDKYAEFLASQTEG